MGPRLKKVALDSMLFIYLFEADPRYIRPVRSLFQKVEQGEVAAVTSIIAVVETLSLPALTEFPDRLLIFREFFQKTPNLAVISPDWFISLEAARLRREYRLRTPDSLQLATAIIERAELFVTHDKQLLEVSGLPLSVVTAAQL